MPRRGIETDTNSAASWTRRASAGAGRQWFPAGPGPFRRPALCVKSVAAVVPCVTSSAPSASSCDRPRGGDPWHRRPRPDGA